MFAGGNQNAPPEEDMHGRRQGFLRRLSSLDTGVMSLADRPPLQPRREEGDIVNIGLPENHDDLDDDPFKSRMFSRRESRSVNNLVLDPLKESFTMAKDPITIEGPIVTKGSNAIEGSILSKEETSGESVRQSMATAPATIERELVSDMADAIVFTIEPIGYLGEADANAANCCALVTDAHERDIRPEYPPCDAATCGATPPSASIICPATPPPSAATCPATPPPSSLPRSASSTATPSRRVRALDHVLTDIPDLALLLASKRATWSDRVEGLRKVSRFTAYPISPAALAESCEPLIEPLAIQLTDLRSQVVKQACETIGKLATTLGFQFELFAEGLVRQLCDLTRIAKKVMSTSGDSCMRTIIRDAHVGSAIIILLNLADNHKSPIVRCRSVEYLSLALKSWNASHIEQFRDELGAIFNKVCSDSTKDVRAAARSLLSEYCNLWPDSGQIVWDGLSANVHKALLAEYPDLARHQSEVVDNIDTPSEIPPIYKQPFYSPIRSLSSAAIEVDAVVHDGEFGSSDPNVIGVDLYPAVQFTSIDTIDSATAMVSLWDDDDDDDIPAVTVSPIPAEFMRKYGARRDVQPSPLIKHSRLKFTSRCVASPLLSASSCSIRDDLTNDGENDQENGSFVSSVFDSPCPPPFDRDTLLTPGARCLPLNKYTKLKAELDNLADKIRNCNQSPISSPHNVTLATMADSDSQDVDYDMSPRSMNSTTPVPDLQHERVLIKDSINLSENSFAETREVLVVEEALPKSVSETVDSIDDNQGSYAIPAADHASFSMASRFFSISILIVFVSMAAFFHHRPGDIDPVIDSLLHSPPIIASRQSSESVPNDMDVAASSPTQIKINSEFARHVVWDDVDATVNLEQNAEDSLQIVDVVSVDESGASINILVDESSSSLLVDEEGLPSPSLPAQLVLPVMDRSIDNSGITGSFENDSSSPIYEDVDFTSSSADIADITSSLNAADVDLVVYDLLPEDAPTFESSTFDVGGSAEKSTVENIPRDSGALSLEEMDSTETSFVDGDGEISEKTFDNIKAISFEETSISMPNVDEDAEGSAFQVREGCPVLSSVRNGNKKAAVESVIDDNVSGVALIDSTSVDVAEHELKPSSFHSELASIVESPSTDIAAEIPSLIPRSVELAEPDESFNVGDNSASIGNSDANISPLDAPLESNVSTLTYMIYAACTAFLAFALYLVSSASSLPIPTAAVNVTMAAEWDTDLSSVPQHVNQEQPVRDVPREMQRQDGNIHCVLSPLRQSMRLKSCRPNYRY